MARPQCDTPLIFFSAFKNTRALHKRMVGLSALPCFLVPITWAIVLMPRHLKKWKGLKGYPSPILIYVNFYRVAWKPLLIMWKEGGSLGEVRFWALALEYFTFELKIYFDMGSSWPMQSLWLGYVWFPLFLGEPGAGCVCSQALFSLGLLLLLQWANLTIKTWNYGGSQNRNYWILNIYFLKIKLNPNWKFERIWDAPFIFLQRSQWTWFIL